jgi:deferrochelatase/peroxidase EfeB
MPRDDMLRASRRRLLVSAGGLAAAMGTGFTARAAVSDAMPKPQSAIEPFWGPHQSGIVTPAQDHSYFVAFDLISDKRAEVVAMLQRWTTAAAALSQGETITVPPLAAAPGATASVRYSALPDGKSGASGAYAAASTGSDQGAARTGAKPGSGGTSAYGSADAGSEPPDAGHDSLEALGLGPSRLTITFGFGAGLFTKDGKDRYGLAASRPPALVDLPRFNGDQLVPARSDGDLSIQACADDPQVAFHAVRELARLAYGVAQVRWVQAGFLSRPQGGGTPRNLLGFKDGTQTPPQIEKVVWAADEGPAWMRGGSYLVVRRIRMALEHWDRTHVSFQEQTIGREKLSGAPLGLKDEFAPLGLDRADKDGNSIIPDTAHVRLANADTNDGAQILRRGYS